MNKSGLDAWILTGCSHQSKISVCLLLERIYDLHGRDRVPELFLFTGWIFVSGSPPDYLPLVGPTGTKGWADTTVFVGSSWNLKRKRKREERGKGKRWASEEGSLSCWMTKLGPFQVRHIIFRLSERDLSHQPPYKCMNVLTSAFHRHTCFYSEKLNVPLSVKSFLLKSQYEEDDSTPTFYMFS